MVTSVPTNKEGFAGDFRRRSFSVSKAFENQLQRVRFSYSLSAFSISTGRGWSRVSGQQVGGSAKRREKGEK